MKRILSILALLAIGLSGCEQSIPGPLTTVSEETVTTNIGETLILPQYVQFDQKIHDLVDCIGSFNSQRTQQNLDAARQCWRDAHAAWVKTEAFLFGPAVTAGAVENLDWFPVFPADIRAKLAAVPEHAFTEEEVFYYDRSLKGFHTIEFLLWDTAGTKQLSDFTNKEFAYMRAVVTEMWTRSKTIYLEWDPTRGDYNKEIRDAGTGTSEYESHREVLVTMLNSMIAACDDLAFRKLGGPLAFGATAEESHFSGNSATDYHNTLVGVQNVYLGGETESGLSIASLIYPKDFLLDARIRSELADAMNKVQLLGPSFAATLDTNRVAVEAAQDAVKALKKSLGDALLIL